MVFVCLFGDFFIYLFSPSIRNTFGNESSKFSTWAWHASDWFDAHSGSLSNSEMNVLTSKASQLTLMNLIPWCTDIFAGLR